MSCALAIILALGVALKKAPSELPRAPANLDSYDVVWTTPSKDSAGSMPIGNGEVVLNAWVEAKTGDLLFYIARSDSLSEISRILKLGRVRVHFDPGPFLSDDFRQHLHLRDGVIEFGGNDASFRLFVDANSNAIRLEGTSTVARKATVTLETWRDQPRTLPKDEMGSAWSVRNAPFPLVESADVVLPGQGEIVWYHRNETSVVPKLWENQSLNGLAGRSDPLLHRTFGGRIRGEGFRSTGLGRLGTTRARKDFGITFDTLCKQTPSEDQWIAELRSRESKPSLDGTKQWWRAYWDRSWVLVGGDDFNASLVTRGYVLQRYVQACQNRGQYPAKFNGGYYTVEPAFGARHNADFRNWGDSHWFQNVRHIVHPMLQTGDFDMMEPFFRLYESNRKLAEARSKSYHGTRGAYFPETMTVYGTYAGGDYGWDRTGHVPADVQCPWWQYAWNQGLELVGLMLDRWDYTRDEAFLKNRVLPMADSVLQYFDTRFRRDSAGSIILDPTQSVETYWTGVVNDMPSTAGLISITDRLCRLPAALVSPARRKFFERMRTSCPMLPMKKVDGRHELSPAQKYDPTASNCENPELYAVWPFRLSTLAHPDLLEEGRTAYVHRVNHLDVGWGYDGNAAALLGLTDEAARILVVKCENSHAGYRWPATWGPNFDWLPDQNHGGNLLNTANLMLLQSEPLESGGAIRLLPAWPKRWDADFKLHAPGNTTVRCLARNGVIETLEVNPPSRAKDIVWPAGWKRPQN